jgi:hypothetical protein
MMKLTRHEVVVVGAANTRYPKGEAVCLDN